MGENNNELKGLKYLVADWKNERFENEARAREILDKNVGPILNAEAIVELTQLIKTPPSYIEFMQQLMNSIISDEVGSISMEVKPMKTADLIKMGYR